jgi:hypothetical protein
MQLDQPIRTCARERVQAIDILSYNHQYLPRVLEPGDGVMDGIGPCSSKSIPALELVIPMLDPRRFRGHEVLEINRLPPRPDTLRTTKIGNAAAGRNSGAGKDQGLVCCSEIIGKLRLKNKASIRVRTRKA